MRACLAPPKFTARFNWKLIGRFMGDHSHPIPATTAHVLIVARPLGDAGPPSIYFLQGPMEDVICVPWCALVATSSTSLPAQCRFVTYNFYNELHT